MVGLVRGVHGLRGAVRVEVLTDEPSRFEPGSRLYAEGSEDPLTVTWAQPDGPGLLLRFREVTDRDGAEPLRDRYLEVVTPRDLPEGSWYWHEVIGANVVSGTGEHLGAVADVFRAGGGEVFVVRGGRRGEVLVPAVRAIIRDLSPIDGRIVVDADALGLDEEPRPRRPRGRLTTRALRSSTPGAPGPEEDADVLRPDDESIRQP